MPRKTALEALERCRRDGAWSRQVLASASQKNGLDRRDTALAGMLFYGVLQNLTLCDAVIGKTARGRLEPKVRDILRIGVYQLLFADRVPDHAAVDQSVSLCRELGYGRAAGLVNAVLRRVSVQKQELISGFDAVKTTEGLSVRYSHPLWIVEELTALRGIDGAEAVLRADNATSPLYLQVNTLRCEPAALAKELGAQMHPELPGCLVLFERTDITALESFRKGLFFVQDPAARMVVLAAGLRPDMRVLDACSAPGGKSFAAAVEMRGTGSVTAADISGAKLRLVEEGAARLGLSSIRCEETDARDWSARGELFDVVFADVPCSGLGVIRKKPEIRSRDKAWLDTLPELQFELLESCAQAVRPGGVLLYSTCTWRRKENEAVKEAFLRSNSAFKATYERTFWPDLDGTDGFYVCRMERENRI